MVRMGIVERKRNEEPGPAGSGLELDLDLRRCPVCRRDLHPWEQTCPVDGAEAVARRLLSSTDLPPPPADLLLDD
jgi:hypothetical protein